MVTKEFGLIVGPNTCVEKKMVKTIFSIVMLVIMLSSHAFAQKKVNSIRRAACEIIESKPIDGGDSCYFYPNFVVVNRCNRAPCRLPRDRIQENASFRCPKGESTTPTWLTDREANRQIILGYFN